MTGQEWNWRAISQAVARTGEYPVENLFYRDRAEVAQAAGRNGLVLVIKSGRARLIFKGELPTRGVPGPRGPKGRK